MNSRHRILIAKASSAGLPAILKELDSRKGDVVAFRDAPPLIPGEVSEPGFDVCLIDLRMLRRAHRNHPEDISRIKQSGVIVLILHSKHLAKARQFSQTIDGLVIADHLLSFINESFMLARSGHSLLPIGILTPLVAGNARTALLATLSKNEAVILGHLGDAQTNQAIAALMMISESSVKGLVRTVLAKLNLMNRTEAAIFAVRHNLSNARPGRDWAISPLSATNGRVEKGAT